MPVNGKVFAADVIEIYLSSSGSGSHSGDGTGAYSHSATGQTYQTPNINDLDIGIYLAAGGSSATNTWSVSYLGPGSPVLSTWTGSWWSSATALVQITDFRLYSDGLTWEVSFDYEVFANGVSKLSGSHSEIGAGLGPAYVPILGVPFGFAGGCSAGTTGLPAYTATDMFDYTSSATGSASAGYRFKYPGESAWTDLPVYGPPGSAPAVSGGCESPPMPSIGGSDTYVMTIETEAYGHSDRVMSDSGTVTECCVETFCDGVSIGSECITQSPAVPWERYKTTTVTKSSGGSARLIPDLDKQIKRLAPDFGGLWYRGKMPQTTWAGSSSCDNNGVVSNVTNGSEVHPNQDVLLAFVQSTTNAIEDTLEYHSYYPKTESGNYEKTITYYTAIGGIICPSEQVCPGPGAATSVVTWVGYTPEPDDESYSSSRGYAFPATVDDASISGYLDHDEPLARYVNTWPNPHWSYFRWREDWEVDGSPQDKGDYWDALGSQYNHNTGASITRNTRNHQWSEALGNDGNATFGDSFLAGLRWLGIWNWQTKQITPRSSYQYGGDQSSLYSADQGSLSVSGTTITVTPT